MTDGNTRYAEAVQVESTKYALLRRLGSVFRHHVVGCLQPITLMCQATNLKLKLVPLDVSVVNQSIDKTSGLVSRAVSSVLDVVAWLSVDENAAVPVGAGIEDCLYHLESVLSFRGFEIHYQKFSSDITVNAAALREVLAATILAAADHAKGWSELEVDLSTLGDTAEITLQMRLGTGDSNPEIDSYRLIMWDEVERLALSHDVTFKRVSNEMVKIGFRRS